MKMPVLFIGHGSPINIIEDNSYTRCLEKLAQAIKRPQAILVVSAHWQTRGTYISCGANPPTIYDFYGFPEECYHATYPCPGAPEQAESVLKTTNRAVLCDPARGIDHAGWAVLKHMYPQADIPVMQMSLDVLKSPREHYEFGKKLAPLRDEGILMMGSGNLVHNLRKTDFGQLYRKPYEWAEQFDQLMADLLIACDHNSIINYENLPGADLAIPTDEHYLPALYTLAMQEQEDRLDFVCTDMQNGSIAMRSFMIAR